MAGKTTVTNWSNARPKLDVVCVVDLHQSQVSTLPSSSALPSSLFFYIVYYFFTFIQLRLFVVSNLEPELFVYLLT